jgi:hypothetical protein
MDVSEPHVRRRGFFLQSDSGEPDTEQENPEGFVVRVRVNRSVTSAKARSAGRRPPSAAPLSRGRQSPPPTSPIAQDTGPMEIRSGSVTGSHQRAHLPR